MPPEVCLEPGTAAELPRLANLMQLYTYEFSNLLDLDVGEDGRFAERDLAEFFRAPARRVFFIRAGGKLAGFAIVDHRSRLSGEEGVADMAEFFVLRRYRRQGIGERAAVLAFAGAPGKWEVRQLASNHAATAFWRKVIGRYTGDRYTERVLDDARWRGPVQFFASSAP